MDTSAANGENPCSFPSIRQLLAQADAGAINVTNTVNDCPTICLLAWGYGNPDLSGIGATISYMLQAVLVFIFGPLFVLVYSLCEGRKRARKYLEKTHLQFLDTSAQFTIVIAIAAVVRLRQSAPFFEIIFMETLLTIQFLGLLSTALAAGVAAHRLSKLRIIVIALYGLVDFGCFMALVGYLRTSKTSWNAIRELGTACRPYQTITPAFVYSEIRAPFRTTAKQYFNPLDKEGVKKRFIVLGIAVASIVAFVLAVIIIGALVVTMLSGWRKWLIGPMSLAFSIAGLALLAEMERKRDVMRTVTREAFQDDQWGFGQVIALFLWAPFIIQLLFGGFMEVLFPSILESLRKPGSIYDSDSQSQETRSVDPVQAASSPKLPTSSSTVLLRRPSERSQSSYDKVDEGDAEDWPGHGSDGFGGDPERGTADSDSLSYSVSPTTPRSLNL